MRQVACKLLVVGFDGLDYELFSSRRPDDVTLHPLYAPVPATGPSWTSLYTGDFLSTHKVGDVFGLEYRRRYSDNETVQRLMWALHNLGRRLRGRKPHERFASRETTASRYLWDTLGEGGVSVKLVNMPITCPVRPVNGIHVGGFPLLRRGRWFYPDDLADRLPDDYVDLVDMLHWFCDPERDSHRRWKRRLASMGFEPVRPRVEQTAVRLADLFTALPSADVQMIQFSFIDRLGHVFGVQGEVERFGYELADRLIGRLRSAINPASLMIISDHGFIGPEHTDLACLGLAGEIAGLVHVPDGYRPTVTDVAPTIAGYFGLTHPCEGNNLLGGEDLTVRSSDLDEQERAATMQRLKDLGYM